jgi:hypothetical protein
MSRLHDPATSRHPKPQIIPARIRLYAGSSCRAEFFGKIIPAAAASTDNFETLAGSRLQFMVT